MHHGMTWGRDYWPIMLIIVFLLFAIPEVSALFTNWSNTLSDYARYELNINTIKLPFNKHSIAWITSMILWIIFVFWITWHIWFEVGFEVK